MNKIFASKKFKHGSLATAMTCLVFAAVILFNAIFTALAEKNLWYTDLSANYYFTLSDSVLEVLEGIDTDVTVLFCNDPDNIENDTYLHMVYKTALSIADNNEHVHVQTVNIWQQPSAVAAFKANSKTNITESHFIVYSGTDPQNASDYRLHTASAMFNYDDGVAWAYTGERQIAASILAVAQAERPVACVTYNHGEPFADESVRASHPVTQMLESAGYRVEFTDLSQKDTYIPDECRMLVIYDPVEDFLGKDGISDVSEIDKINEYLNKYKSMMVFVDPETPVLPNLEEYLSEWGIAFERSESLSGELVGNKVKDDTLSLTNDGLSVIGQYAKKGVGSFPYTMMTEAGRTVLPNVIFRNAMPIKYTFELNNYSDSDDVETKNYLFGSKTSNGVSCVIYDVFNSSSSAVAVRDGYTVSTAEDSDFGVYRLMTLSQKTVESDEGTYHARVIACGSTDFLSADVLSRSSYGNNDVMLYALRALGKETVPANIPIKQIASVEIENLTTAVANRWTSVLIVAPALICTCVAVIKLVRRKYAR